ncbi:CRISPR-associated endonuclease Cas1 [Rugamonas sp. CCM 8940]|uniref:CRISPR-associated endonuclease Cas1 n=1 Tax=Rugamonas sp. CCM 8940 TaxID=2765359 RepID=UPI001F304F28|nr:CRISPR-associated endonuclease Cas1 [Rugamonas sp. CCM 8940]
MIGTTCHALDLMGKFLPVLADWLALSLLNPQQLTEKDFRTTDNGAVFLRNEARKTLLVAYQERKHEELRMFFWRRRRRSDYSPRYKPNCWRGICAATLTAIHHFFGSKK